MDHVEEHGCERIAGREITDVMPSIPKLAREYAAAWAVDVEKKNGKMLDALYEEAIAANREEGLGKRPSVSSPEAFGNSLAFMMMGSGVSWFDSNAEFDLEIPGHEGGEGKL